jgi:hypothetical protein
MALIYHPALKVTVEVPDSTVRVWRKSGWRKASTKKVAGRPPVVNPAPQEGDSPSREEE